MGGGGDRVGGDEGVAELSERARAEHGRDGAHKLDDRRGQRFAVPLAQHLRDLSTRAGQAGREGAPGGVWEGPWRARPRRRPWRPAGS